MARGKIEGRGHLPLIAAIAHQTAIAPRTQRQRHGIEQNGFPGAGFTRQHRQAAAKGQVQPLYENNVADRQLNQHGTRQDLAAMLRLMAASQDLASSRGSSPPVCSSLTESAYHRLSGKLCPSTAAAAWASFARPME